jgi:beta-glucanase (GH16 family)
MAAALLMGSSSVATALIHHRKLKEKLVWQETFAPRKTGAQPDPAIWSYDQGDNGWGNGELETYCAWGSSKGPCDPAMPNAFVGKDKRLHIVARKTANGRYTSARLISLGKKDFKYGRIEARLRITRGQGLWPAFWMMGSDSETNPWPACGEIDVMENVGKEPNIIRGTIHGKGFPTLGYGRPAKLGDDAAFADAYHNYGVLWTPARIAFYVDDPSKPYASYMPQGLAPGAVWPFDARSFYLLLNVAVGGGWPGSPDVRTQFPSEMLVQSIKVWEIQQP